MQRKLPLRQENLVGAKLLLARAVLAVVVENAFAATKALAAATTRSPLFALLRAFNPLTSIPLRTGLSKSPSAMSRETVNVRSEVCQLPCFDDIEAQERSMTSKRRSAPGTAGGGRQCVAWPWSSVRIIGSARTELTSSPPLPRTPNRMPWDDGLHEPANGADRSERCKPHPATTGAHTQGWQPAARQSFLVRARRRWSCVVN